jgi:hypothetical protein
MLAGINYSEADAEFDSHLVFQEVEDLDPVTAMGNSLVSGQEATSGQRINRMVMSHLRNVRYAKFAQEALRTELNNLDIDPSHGSVSSKMESALSTAEFRRRLQQRNRINAVEIPNVQQMISDAGLVRVDASMKQLKKDIERDRLIVNGIRVVGAEAGLDAVLTKICGICDDVHAECGIPNLGDEVKEFVVLSLLSKASRSHSGGIAFQAAQNLIDPATTMLMPQSAVAPPLKINIHLGAFPETRSERQVIESGLETATVNTPPTQFNSVHSSTSSKHTAPFPSSSSSSGKAKNSTGRCGRWGLVCKITGESIFKVQLYDSPVEEGYDDCSTGELEGGEDGTPRLFRAVTVKESAIPESKSESALTEGADGPTNKLESSHRSSSGLGGDGGESNDGEKLPQPSRGVSIAGRNTFVSVIYEDYVLFEVKLAPAGELCNLEHLCDNWKETATVTVTEIEPVRTLM